MFDGMRQKTINASDDIENGKGCDVTTELGSIGMCVIDPVISCAKTLKKNVLSRVAIMQPWYLVSKEV
jgi:hypothetical protein